MALMFTGRTLSIPHPKTGKAFLIKMVRFGRARCYPLIDIS